ncbi:aminotransferase class I/II-fold pyridoxal phosphate-dependent enzyme [Aquilutibacter rugosus]|uniref:aminotransferase class I/II-fold pyridoxal phosphate-dependent enzyme n=1 Tax=Aquilutibacter rugosus TaxID=3115820 RepID=UPI002F3F8B63
MASIPSGWTARLQVTSALLQSRSRQRTYRTVEQREGMRVRVDGSELLDFCSNDYLGLAARTSNHAWKGAAGSGSAHLVSGHTVEHVELERNLCAWLGAESALLLSSGYQANLAAITGLCGPDDLCVQDKLNHASLLDAAQLAGCVRRRYPHLDMDGLQRQLQTPVSGLKLIASDAVFSMDGDQADPAALRAADPDALLYLDEAHSIGVLGPNGEGIGREHAHLRLVTFGKALGTGGAALLGSAALIAHLRQTARPSIFTTALPPVLAARTTQHIRTVQSGDAVARLTSNRAYLRQRADALGVPLQGGDSAIFVLPIGSDADALARSQQLWERGVWVSAIRPPTVPEGTARLRITVSAAHTQADMDTLLEALAV